MKLTKYISLLFSLDSLILRDREVVLSVKSEKLDNNIRN